METEININAIKKPFFRTYIILIILLFISIALELLMLILFIDQNENDIALLYCGLLLVFYFVALIIFIELKPRKQIIQEIGKELRISFSHVKISITDRYKNHEIIESLKWNDIEQIEVLYRSSVISRIVKKDFRIILFIRDKDKYKELLRFKEKDLIYRKRAEQLKYFFLMQYDVDVFDHVKKYWGDIPLRTSK